LTKSEALTFRLPWLLWVVAAALLLIATSRLPYGFYTLLRLAICAFGAVLAYAEFQRPARGPQWAIAFGLVALLFNPLIPVYLTRGIWFPIDVAVAALIVFHLVAVRLWRKF
jgi:hypothetical protein